MLPLSVDGFTQEALPEAWKDGQTTALALSLGLSAQTGQPVPWTVLRDGIDGALKRAGLKSHRIAVRGRATLPALQPSY